MEKINEGGLFELFKNDSIILLKNSVSSTTSNANNNATKSEVIVITNNVLGNAETTLLHNILKAVNINAQATPVLQNTSYEELCQNHQPNIILLFGISGYELGIKNVQINLYTPTSYQNQQILTADSLSVVADSPEKKQALWLNLKKIFQV